MNKTDRDLLSQISSEAFSGYINHMANCIIELNDRVECLEKLHKMVEKDDKGFVGVVDINYFSGCGGEVRTCDYQCDFSTKSYCLAGLRGARLSPTPGPNCPGPGKYRIKFKRVKD